jgi:hypothetical protein
MEQVVGACVLSDEDGGVQKRYVKTARLIHDYLLHIVTQNVVNSTNVLRPASCR